MSLGIFSIGEVRMNLSKINTLLIASFFLFLTATVISHPQASFEASKTGLSMWWEVVFPSLLPFFILSELLIGFGIVRFVGVLLEPFMRPIFRVPGVGGSFLLWEWHQETQRE